MSTCSLAVGTALLCLLLAILLLHGFLGPFLGCILHGFLGPFPGCLFSFHVVALPLLSELVSLLTSWLKASITVCGPLFQQNHGPLLWQLQPTTLVLALLRGRWFAVRALVLPRPGSFEGFCLVFGTLPRHFRRGLQHHRVWSLFAVKPPANTIFRAQPGCSHGLRTPSVSVSVYRG